MLLNVYNSSVRVDIAIPYLYNRAIIALNHSSVSSAIIANSSANTRGYNRYSNTTHNPLLTQKLVTAHYV